MADRRKYEALTMDELVRYITRWVVDVVLVICLALFLTYMLGTRITMEGSSMTPTLESEEKLLLNRFKGSLLPINRFDVLVYTMGESGGTYLKRVLGLPGETIQITAGKVFINGKQLQDSRLSFTISSSGIASEPIVLQEDEYFVIGENTDASLDSRFIDVGNIPRSQILGTVWLRYKPFKKLGIIH